METAMRTIECSFQRSLAMTALGCLVLVNANCESPTGSNLDLHESALGSTSLVISQVYGGGGNASTVYKNDFIEIFNPTATAVSVTGWSVQYASATGSSWSVTNLSGTVQPGHYYLIQEAAGGGGTTNMPTPDATGTISMSLSSAKVALVRNQTALTCSTGCVPNANIADFVGYGSSANSFEGSGPTATLTNTTSVAPTPTTTAPTSPPARWRHATRPRRPTAAVAAAPAARPAAAPAAPAVRSPCRRRRWPRSTWPT
jgi:predicted extracellular nuclease